MSVSPSTDKATIRWTTAAPASSQIKYGTTNSYGKRNGLDPTLAVSHAMTLSWLKPGTLYHFRIMAADVTGALVTSVDYTFVTTSAAVSVSVSPTTATVVSGATQPFAATVTNCTNSAVTWSTSAGSISSSGLFTAPTVTSDQSATVTATSVEDATKSASATVTVKAPVPALGVSPGTLTFAAQHGGSNPAAQNVTVSNTGGGTLNFTVTKDAPWVTVTPTSGTAPRTIQVSSAITGLGPGTYTGHVTITAAGATGSPATVTVVLTVTAPVIEHSVDLSWDASTSTNVVAYNTYRSTIHNGPYELIGSAITSLGHTDRTVLAGVTYYYVVTAVSDAGEESGYSVEVAATVPTP